MVTSLCGQLPGASEVYACERCGHLSSPPLPDLARYYQSEYQILVASEDEDQLYSTAEGKTTYRFDHQLDTLLAKADLPSGARVLDYGAAKGTTLRRLAQRRPDIVPHLFDVSDLYVPFWSRFCPPQRWAVDRVPDEWAGSFDLVMSFYALEHVADPLGFLASVRGLLAPGGRAYAIVPNVFANIGDFLVADHVNHFTRPSLRYAFGSMGLSDPQVDATAHAGAFVVTAGRGEPAVPSGPMPGAAEAVAEAVRLDAYWRGFAGRVRQFEEAHAGLGAVAVYGSGFYGTLTMACLRRPERVSCFLDRNPHRQKARLMDRPILAPEQLPAEVAGLYVGLNPAQARSGVADLPRVRDGRLPTFYP